MFPLSSNTGKLNLNVNRLDANTIRADTYLNLPTGPLGNARKLVNATDMDVLDADTGDLVAFNNANLNMSGGNISNVNELSGSGVDLRIADSVDLLNNNIKNINEANILTTKTGIINSNSSIRLQVTGAANTIRFVEDDGFLYMQFDKQMRFGANINQTNSKLHIETNVDILTNLNMRSNSIFNIKDPVNNQDAATKNYVDNQIISAGSKWDNDAGTATLKTAANINMAGQAIKSLANPVDISDAANKFYVDNNYGSANITGDGSQLNESGSVNITSVDSTTTGIKIITFNADINQSKISLTIHDIGFIVLHKSSVNSIDVYTYNPAGALSNIAFNYIVYPF